MGKDKSEVKLDGRVVWRAGCSEKCAGLGRHGCWFGLVCAQRAAECELGC